MIKTTVYLPDDLKAALERLSKAQDRSEADLIREAIARLTAGSEPPMPTFPLFASGAAPIAERIDEALAQGFGE